MYIRGLILWNSTELAEAVPIEPNTATCLGVLTFQLLYELFSIRFDLINLENKRQLLRPLKTFKLGPFGKRGNLQGPACES